MSTDFRFCVLLFSLNIIYLAFFSFLFERWYSFYRAGTRPVQYTTYTHTNTAHTAYTIKSAYIFVRQSTTRYSKTYSVRTVRIVLYTHQAYVAVCNLRALHFFLLHIIRLSENRRCCFKRRRPQNNVWCFVFGNVVRFFLRKDISTDGQPVGKRLAQDTKKRTLCRDRSKHLSGKLCTKRKISRSNVLAERIRKGKSPVDVADNKKKNIDLLMCIALLVLCSTQTRRSQAAKSAPYDVPQPHQIGPINVRQGTETAASDVSFTLIHSYGQYLTSIFFLYIRLKVHDQNYRPPMPLFVFPENIKDRNRQIKENETMPWVGLYVQCALHTHFLSMSDLRR